MTQWYLMNEQVEINRCLLRGQELTQVKMREMEPCNKGGMDGKFDKIVSLQENC